MKLGVALAAEEAAGVQALRLLAGREHRLVAVLTGSGPPGPGATVAGLAKKLEVPVRPAAEVRDPALGDWLRAQGTDLLLNVHSLHIVHPDVVEAPALGSFNLHPGPLPGCAGMNVPSWALYEGAESHGVTLHRMTAAIDEGPIAFSDSFQVGPDDTALTVLTQCVRRGLPLIGQLLAAAARGDSIPAHAQDPTRRRWFGPGPPEGGRLGWDRPAHRVVDFVRACDYGPFRSPWGFPRCVAGEQEVAIAAAEAVPGSVDAPPGTVIHDDGPGALVAAADGWVRVERVVVAGRRADAAEVLRPGQRLGPARDGGVTAERTSAR
jgi:methionyl-tRNA formyltransferase